MSEAGRAITSDLPPEVSGFAYVAVLPFDMLMSREGADPRSMAVGETRVTVYWPFATSGASARTVPSVRREHLPVPVGRYMTVLQGVAFDFQNPPPDGAAFADGLRLDIHDRRADDKLAADFVRRLLRHFRLASKQWWIGHPHRAGHGLVRNRLAINEAGGFVDANMALSASVDAYLPGERAITRRDFAAAVEAVAHNREVPLYREMLLDAVFYSLAAQDNRRALLESAIACEHAVLVHALRLAAELGVPERTARRRLHQSDLLRNLRYGLPNIARRAIGYDAVAPGEYALIKRLWGIRGDIAHGRLPAIGQHARTSIPTHAECAELIMAADRLVDWLEQLRPT